MEILQNKNMSSSQPNNGFGHTVPVNPRPAQASPVVVRHTQTEVASVQTAQPQNADSKAELGKILVSLGVKEAHVHAAIQRQKVARKPLQEVARDMGLVSSEKIAEAMSLFSKSPYFSASEVDKMDAEEIRKIQELLDKDFTFKGFIPVGFKDGSLKVAVPGMENMNAASNTFRAYKPTLCIASEKTIQRVYRMFFAKTAESFDSAMVEAIAALKSTSDDIGSEGAIQRLIGSLLRHTCFVGASDIYLWSTRLAGTIKLKIGGRGTVFRSVEKDVFDRMVNFLVMNSGKQEELNRAPQDAKVELRSPEIASEFSDIMSRYVFRMSLVQAPDANRTRTVVIRANDSQSAESDFDSLGFKPADAETIRRYSASPTGLVLVTGPTGSGKTTSLYAVLREIDPIERAIFTMEKPIEYRHGSWIQHELGQDQNEGDEARGMLKALLREAPDVILVGELRDDPELIKTALAASNTGHLVFATLHTNDAPSAIMRLTQMGAPKEVLASVLKGVLAQRLVPLLCPHCAVADDRETTHDELNSPVLVNHKKHPKRSVGCVHCDFVGYRGRAMVYELMDATSVRHLIESGAPLSEIKTNAYTESSSMWAKGLAMVAEGLTSIEQLMARVDKA